MPKLYNVNRTAKDRGWHFSKKDPERKNNDAHENDF